MKTLMRIVLVGSMLGGLSITEAALLVPGSAGTIQITAGCFGFDNCATSPLNLTDNGVLVNGVGSSIEGDGLVGIINFVVGSDGNSFRLTSFNVDAVLRTGAGDIAMRMVDPSLAGGTISDNGEMTLIPTGRTAIFGFVAGTIGEQPLNREVYGPMSTHCAPGSGQYAAWTTGTQTAINCSTGEDVYTLSGSALSASVNAGQYLGMGTLISASNLGIDWAAFEATPYTELYHITVSGSAVIPIPAAVWLMGSGLISLLGFARLGRIGGHARYR